MTAIKENKRKGKVISYRFTAYLGKDSEGKQIKKTTTWHPPSDLTPAKERKAAERAADLWELSLKGDEPEVAPTVVPLPPAPAKAARSDDFVSFMNDVWFPLAIEGSDRKPKTVYAYKTYLVIESKYFKSLHDDFTNNLKQQGIKLIKNEIAMKGEEISYWRTDVIDKVKIRTPATKEETDAYNARKFEILKVQFQEAKKWLPPNEAKKEAWARTYRLLWAEYRCCYYSCKRWIFTAFNDDTETLREIYELVAEIASPLSPNPQTFS